MLHTYMYLELEDFIVHMFLPELLNEFLLMKSQF